jgi:hypothetical protein
MVLAVGLMVVSPVAVSAKTAPFNAVGTIASITPGDVFPAGDSGRWVVAERQITGTLGGGIDGDFTLTYKANVESVLTQAGNLHGTLSVGDYVLNVTGKLPALSFFGWYVQDVIPLYKMDITGKWTLQSGSQGNGDFSATVIFIPTPDGHVYAIVNSYISLTGNWNG